ncbi:MAG: recombinase family protein [Candidatus Obscuribacterales bacterium]|nr:recombinase family protein [Candidatus Obscuribacterales bacterium]
MINARNVWRVSGTALSTLYKGTRQVAELTTYASRSNFEIVAIVKGTARETTNDQVERKKVMDLYKKPPIDLVLVSELSQWSRSTADLHNTIEDLEAHQVAIGPSTAQT